MNTLIWIFIALLMIAVDILVVEVIFIEKELGASLKVIDKYMDTILLIITDMTGISEDMLKFLREKYPEMDNVIRDIKSREKGTLKSTQECTRA